MTENEAKTKTCHKTLAPVASADGSAPWHSPAACIGSDCMAWRESEPPKSGGVDFSTGHHYEAKPAQGFCGLAGKP